MNNIDKINEIDKIISIYIYIHIFSQEDSDMGMSQNQDLPGIIVSPPNDSIDPVNAQLMAQHG